MILNKYYRPDIEEFHVGFEYERFIPRSNTTEEECWNQLSMSINYLSLDEIDDEIIEKEIRVKYLDREDIENFGFVLVGKSIDLWFERKGIYLRDDGYHLNNIKLQYGTHDQRLKITFLYVSGEEQIHFEGTIKNKSELKKLMKQLGINDIK